MEPRKRLPLSTQSFPKLIRSGCVYVDKTEDIYRLITGPGARFLSRPRRFGKSLLVSTLEAIFQGRRALFQGLWIAGEEAGYDWPVHPVIRLDLSRIAPKTPEELDAGLIRLLTEAAREKGLEPGAFNLAADVLDDLIARLAKEKGPVVVLVDEYDKPILDHLTDTPVALGIRDRLQTFYTILKAQDEHLRFVFLTGVSRFSKVSVFSGMNQLDDITRDAQYGAILGITQDELESNFEEHIRAAALHAGCAASELLARIRAWYNGYRFHPASETVHNPFSCLTYLERREFGYWWFETGTPGFLIDLLRRFSFPIADLERKAVLNSAFSNFEVDRLDPLPLLHQTGYLTITDYDAGRGLHTLDYPNREVREAFLAHLAEGFLGRAP